MNKKQKVNYIKAWLQRFGERDNETFYIEVKMEEETWLLALQYDYDFDGDRISSFDWCWKSFKHVGDTYISDRNKKELDEIIRKLNIIKRGV